MDTIGNVFRAIGRGIATAAVSVWTAVCAVAIAAWGAFVAVCAAIWSPLWAAVKGIWLGVTVAFLWLRHQAVAYGFSLLLFSGLIFLTLWLLKSMLGVDKTFLGPLAPSTIDDQVIIDLGYVLRFFAVLVGMAIAWAGQRKMRAVQVAFTAYAVLVGIVLAFHAMGLAYKSMEEQYVAGSVTEDVAGVQTRSIDDQIADIDTRIDELTTEKDKAVETANAAIQVILTDRLDNDSEADPYRQDIRDAQAYARDEISKLEDDKRILRQDSGTVSADATRDAAFEANFNPLFVGIARFTDGKWNPAEQPSEVHAYVIGIIFWFLWYATVEALLMGLPLLLSTMIFAAAAKWSDENKRPKPVAEPIEPEPEAEPAPEPSPEPANDPKPRNKQQESREFGKDTKDRKKIPVPDLETQAAQEAAE